MNFSNINRHLFKMRISYLFGHKFYLADCPNHTLNFPQQMSKKSTLKSQSPKPPPPIINEFQAACKALNFNDDSEIQSVSAYLAKCDYEVKFSNKKITGDFSKVLLKMFPRCTQLKRLVFFNCTFEDPEFFSKFASELPKESINQVHFDFCTIQRDYLVPFLTVPNLDALNVRGNKCITSYMSPDYEESRFTDSVNRFYNALTKTHLKVIDFSGCNLGDVGVIALSRALFFNNTLLCLNLTSNKITDVGAEALSEALSFYILTKEDIEIRNRLICEETRSKINDDGSELVKKKKGGKAPPKKTPAKQKKGQPVKIPEKSFCFNPDIPVQPALYASWDNTSQLDDGTMYIQGNRSLTTLILNNNRIGRKGLYILKEMLGKNETIINFSIRSNPDIPEDEAEEAFKRYIPPPPPPSTPPPEEETE